MLWTDTPACESALRSLSPRDQAGTIPCACSVDMQQVLHKGQALATPLCNNCWTASFR